MFLPPSFASKYPSASYVGHYINFEVRELASLAVFDSISSSSCLFPCITLVTVFYQYGLPAIRMASVSKFLVLYMGRTIPSMLARMSRRISLWRSCRSCAPCQTCWQFAQQMWKKWSVLSRFCRPV